MPTKRHKGKRHGKKKEPHYVKYAVAAVFVAAVVLFYGLGGNNELGQRGPPQPELLSERYRRMVKRAPKQYKVNIRKFRRTELQAIQEGDAFMACAMNTNYANELYNLMLESRKDKTGNLSKEAEYFSELVWRRGAALPTCEYGAHNLATTLRDRNRADTNEATYWFNQSYIRSRGITSKSNRYYKNRYPRLDLERPFRAFDMSFPVALRFQAEQLNALVEEGRVRKSYRNEVKAYHRILKRNPDPSKKIELQERELSTIPSYRRALYIAHKPRLAGHALTQRSEAEVRKIEAKFKKESVVVVDNFLTPEALEMLHEFASRSTIYTDVKPPTYVGSYWDDGFNTPLLSQVTEEMASMFAGIFKDYPLKDSWAYNYDNGDYQKGINVHADEAAVNCNLWITPDSANLDKKSGGLIVYTKPPPLDWSFFQFNNEHGGAAHDRRIKKLLKDSAKIVVPYRQNRILLFKSDLMHSTDKVKFKPGFKNRRINLTFLFGDRGQGDDATTIKQRTEQNAKLRRKQLQKRRGKKSRRKKR